MVLDVLRDCGLPPHRLMLEITESMLVDDTTNARQVLSRLREPGCAHRHR